MNGAMWMLMRKDWRLSRAPLVGAAVFFVIPYIIGAYAYFREREWERPSELWVTVGYFAWTLMAMCAGAVAGNIFAGERSIRSAEFLHMLPVSRRRILASKLIVGGVCAVGLWVVGAAAVLIPAFVLEPTDFVPAVGAMAMVEKWIFTAPGILLAGAIACFGVAWCCSAVLSKPSLCTVIGIAASVAVGVWLAIWASGRDLGERDAMRIVVCSLSGLGVAGLIAGSWHYLVRRRP